MKILGDYSCDGTNLDYTDHVTTKKSELQSHGHIDEADDFGQMDRELLNLVGPCTRISFKLQSRTGNFSDLRCTVYS